MRRFAVCALTTLVVGCSARPSATASPSLAVANPTPTPAATTAAPMIPQKSGFEVMLVSGSLSVSLTRAVSLATSVTEPCHGT